MIENKKRQKEPEYDIELIKGYSHMAASVLRMIFM